MKKFCVAEKGAQKVFSESSMSDESRKLQATCAEALAIAFCSLFPEAQPLSAGVDGLGFYYDFAVEQKVDDSFISRIEEIMRDFLKTEETVSVVEMMRENAAQLFLHKNLPYKSDLIGALPFNIVPIVAVGDFRDFAFESFLQALPSKTFCKILSITPRLFFLESVGQISALRVYGVAFDEKKDLKAFIKQWNSNKQKNHVSLGAEMGLFLAGEGVAEGGVQWLSKGARLREMLLSQWRLDHANMDFSPFYSQSVVDVLSLSKSEQLSSKFFPHFEQEGVEYVWASQAAKEHAADFSREKCFSWELPMRFCEWQNSFKSILPQHIDALFNSPACTADYATVFCAQDQVVEELISSLQYINKIINMVGAKFRWFLVFHGRKRAGTASQWAKALHWISEASSACGITLEEKLSQSEAADEVLAGPQIQVHFADALGRWWCGSKIGMNFHLPTQQALCYQESDGSKRQPVMLERTAFNSLERVIALMLEGYNGMLPLALAPEQFRILPVGPGNYAYSKEIFKELQRKGYRANLDSNLSPLGAKIHAAECAKVPYVLIIGNQELNDKVVSVRSSGGKEKALRCSLEDFLERLKAEDVLPAETLN